MSFTNNNNTVENGGRYKVGKKERKIWNMLNNILFTFQLFVLKSTYFKINF